MEDRIRETERRYEELSSLLADPATIADPARLREFSREHSQLTEVVAAAEQLRRSTRELNDAREMLEDSGLGRRTPHHGPAGGRTPGGGGGA